MVERIRCCVPFCRHTRGQHKGEQPLRGDEEWICGEHWRLVSPHLRRRKAKLYRLRHRRFGEAAPWTFPAGSAPRIEAVKLDRMCAKAWVACKRAAIEAAGGIA